MQQMDGRVSQKRGRGVAAKSDRVIEFQGRGGGRDGEGKTSGHCMFEKWRRQIEQGGQEAVIVI